MKKILCIDVGGTFIKYGICTESGVLDQTSKIETPKGDLEQFIQCLISIKDLFEGQIQGVGISLPGTIDSETGYIYQGGSLNYNNGINLVDLLETTFELPVTIENDARCAAIAEIWKGNLRQRKSGIMLTVGTGIGGAIVVQNRILQGHHQFSGEFSGLLSTSETIIGEMLGAKLGFSGFVKKVQEIKNDNKLTGKDVLKLADKNDELIINLLKTYTRKFAQEIYNLQLVIDPECFLLGGGVSEDPLFEKFISFGISDFYKKLPIKIPLPNVIISRFHNNANLIGASRRFFLGERYLNEYAL